MSTSIGITDSTMVSLPKTYLSNFVGMLLLVKAIVTKKILVIVSRVIMVILVVQTLKSMRIGYTSYSSLSKRIRLRIGLTASS